MVDILGPSGQPVNPNPFMSQSSSGMSGNLSINTQSAQQAMADFQKVLDGMMKSFGGNWDKVSKDSMAAQERFYRYIGDKDKEREIALRRYRDEAINAIDDQTKAEIAALSQKKLAQEDLEKQKTEIINKASRDRAKIIEDSARKEKQSGGIGGWIREKTSSLGGQVGGPIGGFISGAGAVLTNPFALIGAAIFETAMANARSARVGAQLAGAGFGVGSAAGVGANFTTGIFGNSFSKLGIALGAEQQAQIIGQMTGSRTIIDQARGAGGFSGIRNNLGLFANILPDASKEMELFTDATKNLGMTQKDISNTFMTSRVNADRLKITQLDAIQTQMDMAKALRNITNDGAVAANVLFTVGGFFKDIGKSEAERTRMTLGIAQAGANLSLPTMTGMATFLNGEKMPTFSQMFGGPESGIGPSNGGLVGNPFAMMGQFITKIGGQFQNPMQKMFAADALNKQLGLGIQTQDLPQLFKLASTLGQPGGVNNANFAEQVEKLSKKSKQMTVEGMDKLVEIVGPIQKIENLISNIWKDLDKFIIEYTKSNRFQTMPSPLAQKNINEKARIQKEHIL